MRYVCQFNIEACKRSMEKNGGLDIKDGDSGTSRFIMRYIADNSIRNERVSRFRSMARNILNNLKQGGQDV